MMHVIGSGCMAVKLPLEENLLLQRQLGFRETDLLFVSGWAHVGTDELLRDYSGICRRVERALGQADMKAGAVNVKYSCPLEAKGDEAEQRRREADAMMDFMAEFGVTRISIQPTLSMDPVVLESGFEPAVQETLLLRDRYARRGMKLSLEPHTMSSFCFGKVLSELKIRYPDFQITFDPSHLLCEGEEMPGILDLAADTAMVHLRDAAKGRLFVPYGEGALDLPACIGRLADAGYDGPIALEYIFDDRPDEAERENLFEFRAAVENEIDRYRLRK